LTVESIAADVKQLDNAVKKVSVGLKNTDDDVRGQFESFVEVLVVS
jgi:hypothetical protein